MKTQQITDESKSAGDSFVSGPLPCPFCGGTDIRFTNHGKVSRDIGHLNDDVWSTCCYTCGATFPNRYRREVLVQQWNRRPLHDQAECQVSSLSPKDDSALIWHPSTELPPESKTCLCRGDSYDAFTHDGYLLAYIVQGTWVTGKQQNEVTVTEWALLPNS